MIAIRAYWSQAEAALAKSVLDNYEIPCALLHENANLYGRAPFAMPVRLVAVEDRAEWAAYVLSSDFEAAAKIEEIAAENASTSCRGGVTGACEGQPLGAANDSILLLRTWYLFPAHRISSQALVQPRGPSRDRRGSDCSFSRLDCNRVCYTPGCFVLVRVAIASRNANFRGVD